LGHDVADRDETGQQLPRSFGTEDQRHAELLDVVVLECAAEIDPPPLVDERRRAAQDVPTALAYGIFDPDDLGTEGREVARRAGPGELPGEVTHPNASEGHLRSRRSNPRAGEK